MNGLKWLGMLALGAFAGHYVVARYKRTGKLLQPVGTFVAAVRDLLDRIPTPLKVALWLGLSAFVAKVAEALTSGAIKLDPTTLAIANIALVLVRSWLDKHAPAISGATSAGQLVGTLGVACVIVGGLILYWTWGKPAIAATPSTTGHA